jgi:hypothetical protein
MIYLLCFFKRNKFNILDLNPAFFFFFRNILYTANTIQTYQLMGRMISLTPPHHPFQIHHQKKVMILYTTRSVFTIVIIIIIITITLSIMSVGGYEHRKRMFATLFHNCRLVAVE